MKKYFKNLSILYILSIVLLIIGSIVIRSNIDKALSEKYKVGTEIIYISSDTTDPFEMITYDTVIILEVREGWIRCSTTYGDYERTYSIRFMEYLTNK